MISHGLVMFSKVCKATLASGCLLTSQMVLLHCRYKLHLFLLQFMNHCTLARCLLIFFFFFLNLQSISVAGWRVCIFYILHSYYLFKSYLLNNSWIVFFVHLLDWFQFYLCVLFLCVCVFFVILGLHSWTRSPSLMLVVKYSSFFHQHILTSSLSC